MPPWLRARRSGRDGNIIEIVSKDLGQRLPVLVDLEFVAKHQAELRAGYEKCSIDGLGAKMPR